VVVVVVAALQQVETVPAVAKQLTMAEQRMCSCEWRFSSHRTCLHRLSLSL
jgi:hypothetical protein